MINLSLIIPCYNEAKNLPALIERCSVKLADKNIEVILVDNGSQDESPQIFDQLLKEHAFIRSTRVENNQGYGYGILAGLKVARGNYLGWTHADLQTDPSDVLQALEIIQTRNHSDSSIFIKGKRFGRPLSDVFFTVGMGVFETILLQTYLMDINAQPTIFSRNFYEMWKNPPYDFSLDLFAFYMARKNKISIFRFPVKFGERLHGVSHWNINWKAKIKFIRRTVEYSFKLRKQLREKR